MMKQILFYIALWCLLVNGQLITETGATFPIYQWSVVSFPEEFNLSLTANNYTCFLGPIIGASRDSALNLVTKYKNLNVPCIVFQVITHTAMGWMSGSPYKLLRGTVPVGMVGIDTAHKNLGVNHTISVTYQGWSDNFLYDFQNTHMAAFLVTNLISILCCFALGGYKVHGLFNNDLFGFNIASVCIVFELIYAVFRLARTSILLNDLSSVNYIHEPINTVINLVIYIVPFAFNLSSGVFMFFFLFNLNSGKIYKNRGTLLQKAFWPSFVMVALIFLLDLIFAVLLTVGAAPFTTLRGISLVMTALCGLFSILYFLTAVQTYRYAIKRSSSHGLKLIAMKILLSGVSFLVIFSCSVAGIYLVDTDVIVSGFVLDLFFSFRSLLQIDIFGTIKKKGQEIVVMTSSKKSDSSKNQEPSSAP